MRRLVLTMLLVPATLATAMPGWACRVYRPPAQKIEDGRESGAITAVALVRITAAGYTQPPSGDAHPWEAAARIEHVVSGALAATMVRFGAGFGSAACDDGYPPPEAGARWMLYFRSKPTGEQAVWAAYPAPIAYGADPVLTAPR